MCNCRNVEIGTYGNQVILNPPKHMRRYRRKIDYDLSEYICIDKCLEDEIKYLWSLGVTTTGCCCGHNKTEGYIGVIDKDIPRMKELDYKVQFNEIRPSDEDSFYPKSL